ncbi:bactericidal permeability-increasing protein-like [Amphiura filiformis]|uniref:bactericidal permeability-increasing protein-like n=1 Tax=Amphiura filiformis TaxID=82378 RepID=UPI003B212D23
MQSFICSVLALGVILCLSNHLVLCGNPGFKARLTQKGVDYLRDVGIDILKKELSSLSIPDMSGTSHIGVGKVDYTVSNMRFTSLGIPSPSLLPNPTIGGVELSANGLSLSLSGDWRYKAKIAFIPVKDHGTFDMSASGISLRLAIRIGVDSFGRPTISSRDSDCSFGLGSLHVKFHGGASWIYNLFDDGIESSLKKSIRNEACKEIRKEVNEDLSKEVAKLKVVAKIDNIAEIDYSLVSPSNFYGAINMENKGEVFPIGKRNEAPFPVPLIPDDPDTRHMLEIYITEFLLESAGFVYYSAGFFQYNLTQDKIPPDELSLDTSSLTVQSTISELKKLFPNMLLQVNVKASRSPEVIMTPDALNGTAQMDAKFFVQLPNKTLHYICTMEYTAHASAILGVQGNDLTWNATYVGVDVKLVESNIGKIDMKFMRGAVDLVDLAMLSKLMPWLNDEGKKGIPLPSVDDVSFENPVLTLKQGYFKLGVDVSYKGVKK